MIQHFEISIDSELALCKEFLKLDQRNFHCWNYRRFLVEKSVEKGGEGDEQEGKGGNQQFIQEMEFSTEKIKENFSNYSAFHHRSLYIKTLLSEMCIEDILQPELTIIESAIFTEPDDQSAWWYQQFLLVWVSKVLKQEANEHLFAWFYTVLEAQLVMVESLLEIEVGSKWAMNSIILMLNLLLLDVRLFYRANVKLIREEGGGGGGGGGGDGGSMVEKEKEEEEVELEAVWLRRKRDLLTTLLNIDSLHTNRYKYLLAQIE